jgi:hypothetical protein
VTGGVSKIPTTKEELVKSIIGMKQEGNQNLEKVMEKEKEQEPEVKPEDKGTINDTNALANQIKSNNLIEVEKEKESINLDEVKKDLEKSEFQSIHSEKANYSFNNGWAFLGEVEEDGLEDGVEGLLKSPEGQLFDVKLTKMGGTNMGVFNDFIQKKVFFVNFDSKTITPSA